MKVLIDSNVILEVILQREEYEVANCLLRTLINDKHEMLLTSGCFYGMMYTVDKYLRKEMKQVNPGRTDTLRSIMAKVLSFMSVAGQDRDVLLRGIGDSKFTDLEDSCQYQAAQKAGCEVLLTFNDIDYPVAEGAVPCVMTPQVFLENYT